VLQHAVREVADVVAASDCGGGGLILGRFARKHRAGRQVEDATRLSVRRKEKFKEDKRLAKLKQRVAGSR
jgi:hypothetical protein